jgi:HTH-type transcriptional regulator, sugar sensing transcriptional regulator
MPQVEPVMEEAYNALIDLGFGSYEARAYCAMLNTSPANGYQIAQKSGIPRAKIYECLQRLVARGAAVQVETQGDDPRLFVPTDPKALVDRMQDNFDTALTRARDALKRYQDNPRVAEVLWRITSQQDLIERGRKLADGAQKSLHVAIWSEEFAALLPHFLGALERDVRMALVLYDPHPEMERLQERCAGAILHGRSKRQAVPVMGRQFVLVADRERCISGSVFPDDKVEGVYTLNLGLVTNAVDLVNHEIYLERVMVAIGDPIVAIFGPDLEQLDPFFPPAPPSVNNGRT